MMALTEDLCDGLTSWADDIVGLTRVAQRCLRYMIALTLETIGIPIKSIASTAGIQPHGPEFNPAQGLLHRRPPGPTTAKLPSA